MLKPTFHFSENIEIKLDKIVRMLSLQQKLPSDHADPCEKESEGNC